MTEPVERVWLCHPDVQTPFHCPVAAAPGWKKRGWKECDPPEEQNPAVAEYVPLRPAAIVPSDEDPAVEAAPEPAKPSRTSPATKNEGGKS